MKMIEMKGKGNSSEKKNAFKKLTLKTAEESNQNGK